jgi:hypothetical protein
MQDDSADQIFEELQDIVQQAILREFPNPERKGCPGPAVLRELANRPRPTRDAPWEHVTHCSPCYREFLDLRTQVKTRRDAEHRRLVRRRVVVSGSVVVVAGLAVGGYEVIHRAGSTPNQTTGPYQSASLDLKDRSVARSVEGQNTKAQALVLPAKRLDLTVLLPIGSEPGRYDVQLLKSIDQPLLKTSGEATVEHGVTALRAKLDLSGQPSGSFLLGLRQPPSDWTYYPVTVQ